MVPESKKKIGGILFSDLKKMKLLGYYSREFPSKFENIRVSLENIRVTSENIRVTSRISENFRVNSRIKKHSFILVTRKYNFRFYPINFWVTLRFEKIRGSPLFTGCPTK